MLIPFLNKIMIWLLKYGMNWYQGTVNNKSHRRMKAANPKSLHIISFLCSMLSSVAEA